MILRDFPLHLMETLKCWRPPHGYLVVFMLLTTVSKGWPCEAPSSPQCFRRNADESVYICEWSMNTTESDVTFDLHIDETKFGSIKETRAQLTEEQLFIYRPVNIWVEAHGGNTSCTSARRSVVLWHTVKYEAPKNITISWLKNNLALSWTEAEKHPALAEVQFRRLHPTESWENRITNTTNENSVYQVTVLNLLKNTAYQVQIRQRSNQAPNPLWSDWSPVVIVPAELEQNPEVNMTPTLLNGTRKVMLSWKPMPDAAAVSGVTYILNDTQSSKGCPCEKRTHFFHWTKYTTYVTYSAVNISVIARNTAGYSPPAIIQVPAKCAADLKSCDKTLLDEKLQRRTCLELYELQDGDSRPVNAITLTASMTKKERKKIKKNVKDYVRYLYFEHKCDGGKPQTVKVCLFYQKEGVPHRKPQSFTPAGETEKSVELSWKAIPSMDLRGFLKHYSLCSIKISPQDEPKECHNISASLTKCRLENLTPGAKYNISLAGVTQVGEGPKATVTINTLPEKPVNVLWSISLMFLFFLISTSCPFILTKIKSKMFPPVPTPVIPDFTPYQAESQETKQSGGKSLLDLLKDDEMLEREEEVHELTLLQLLPEGKSVPEFTQQIFISGGVGDDDTDEDMGNESGDSRMSRGSSDDCMTPDSTDQELRSSKGEEMTDLEQVDKEVTMLLYRNGLVFDLKTE